MNNQIDKSWFKDGNGIIRISDDRGELGMWLFYDEDELTQIRFMLADEPENKVKDHSVSISYTHFTYPIQDDYTIEYERDGKTVQDYYGNDGLWMYFEITKKGKYVIKEGFSPDGLFFHREIEEYSKNGVLISCHFKFIEEDGSHNTYKTYYNEDGDELYCERIPMPLISRMLEDEEERLKNELME